MLLIQISKTMFHGRDLNSYILVTLVQNILPTFSKPIPRGNSLPQIEIFASSSSDIPSTMSWVGRVGAVLPDSILAEDGTLWEPEEVPVLLDVVSDVWLSAMLFCAKTSGRDSDLETGTKR